MLTTQSLMFICPLFSIDYLRNHATCICTRDDQVQYFVSVTTYLYNMDKQLYPNKHLQE